MPLERLLNADGTPTVRLMSIWQESMDKIEEAFEALSTQVADNAALLAEIQAAQVLASAANDNATTANRAISIADSYVSPADLLSASNDGTITIAAHTRFYGDGSSVSVGAGSVSGFTSNDYVTVYYKDAAREGGSVTYVGTISAVAQKGDVHVVGQALIPASGEPPVTGSSTGGSGYTPPGDGARYDPDYVDP
jgi:hypothetical protein